WKTMPMRRRTCTGSTPGPYRFSPSSRTSPATPAPGTVSCMRLIQRMNVDFPQPDGPMIAVTALGATVRSTPCSTSDWPNHARSPFTQMPSPMLTSANRRPAPGRHSRGDTGHEDERDQDQRPCPRLPVPVVVRQDGVRVDLQRQGGDRLVEPVMPKAV